MSPRKLLLLTAVVLLLFGFIVFFERKMPTTADRDRKGDLVWDLPESRIESVRLENAGSVVELQRANGTWRLIKPEAYPADTSAVSDLVSQLASLKRVGADVAGARPADYGLTAESPKATLVWKEEGSNRRLSRTLMLGRDIPGTDSTAARAEGDSVFFVPSSVSAAVRKSADEYKSKELFAGSGFDAARLDIDRGRGRLSLAKKNGSWWISQPISDLADGDAIQRTVSDLTGLKALGFLSAGERQDLASLGLAPPLYRVTLADAKGVSTTVDFGSTRSDGNSVYARREGQVLTVPSTITEELSKEAVGFREPHLVRFEASAVTTVTGAFGGKSVSLEHSSTGWRSAGKPLQESPADELLSALLEVKSRSFLEDTAAAPLKNRPATATVAIKAPPTEWTINFYTARADAQATVSGRPGAFVLSGDPVAPLEAAFQKAAASLAPTPVPTAAPTKAAKK
jgi:hypothetical protein